MGNQIEFEIGCRRCKNLLQTGKNTYICSTRAHMDDSAIVPIKDGVHTSDWGLCDGEYYVREGKD